jgi:hypothetical protein
LAEVTLSGLIDPVPALLMDVNNVGKLRDSFARAQFTAT